jgi:hypothetical protein
MARKVNAFLMSACLLFAVDAEAISGNEWGRLSQTAQQYYIIGVIDGWDNLGTIALLDKQPPSVGTRFAEHIKCTAGMPYEQIVATVQKYMANNLDRWNAVMASLVWLALDDVCSPTSK